MNDSKQVAVIGGGISGLACAYRLQQLSITATLLEAGEHVGGLMGTIERDGFLFESGPQSFQGTEQMLDLIRELGLDGELCEADPKAPRYILKRGKLQKVPMSPQAMMTSSLLGARARLKIASEALGKSRPPTGEETVAGFVRRKFGHEILEYLVSPFVSGVYAGDPEKLSLRAAFPSLEEWEREYGSVLRGAMKSHKEGAAKAGPPPLCSFQHGMQRLAQGMASKLFQAPRTSACIAAIKKTASGQGNSASYQLRIVHGGQEETMTAQTVVVATPAYVASHLVAPLSAPLAQTLSGVEYASLAVIATSYYTHQLQSPLDGFGVLIPRSEKYRTLGVVWNSSLFPHRAPDGQTTITSFVGGATDPEMAEKSDEAIAAIVQEENARILGITGQPTSSPVWKHAKALPQYNLGHAHIVRAIRDGEQAIPGLFFAGNYLQGPSIGKCIEQGYQTAEAIRKYLQAGA